MPIANPAARPLRPTLKPAPKSRKLLKNKTSNYIKFCHVSKRFVYNLTAKILNYGAISKYMTFFWFTMFENEYPVE